MKWDLDVRPDGACAPSAELLNALGRFSRLQHLELSQHGSLASFEGVKKIIAAFPALSSLSLFGALWTPVCPNEQSSGLAPGYNRPTLAKLSVSTGYGCPKQPIDDVLLWLSTTPTQYLLRELAFDVGNLNSALRLIAGRSLSVVDVAFDIAWPEPFDDSAQAAQLQRLASQVGEIELIRLHLMDRGWDVHFVTWSGVARVLRIFAASASVRRLRLCCRSFGSDSSPDGASPDMLACAAHLDPVLASSENNAFRSLRAVEFAMYVYDRSGSEKALEKHYALYSAWVQGMLPHLHERGIAEIYVYNDVEVFGPAGLNSHGCEPDFPHAYPPAPC